MVPRPPIGARSPKSDSLPLYSDFHSNHVSDREKRNGFGIVKKTAFPKGRLLPASFKAFFNVENVFDDYRKSSDEVEDQ